MSQKPEQLRVFQMGLAAFEKSAPITASFDFNQLAAGSDDVERPLLVDVGGGQGQAIIGILRKFPDLPASRFVLQDLPDPITNAKTSQALPSAVVKMEHDIWTEQPVKGN